MSMLARLRSANHRGIISFCIIIASLVIFLYSLNRHSNLPRQIPNSPKPALSTASPTESSLENLGTDTIAGIALPENPNSEMFAIGKKSVADAFEFIESNYPEEKKIYAKAFLIQELVKERLDLLVSAEQLIPQTERESTLVAIADHWANRDISAFVQFLQPLKNAELKNSLLAKAAIFLGGSNRFNEARQTIDMMPFSSDRSLAIFNVASAFKGENGSVAIDWAASLPLEEDVVSAKSALGMRFARDRDLQSLVKLASISPTSPDQKIWTDIGRIAGENGAAQLPDVVAITTRSKDVQHKFLLGKLETAPFSEIRALFESAVSVSDVETRDAATSILVRRTFAQDPAAAVQWAINSPPPIRPAALRQLVEKWYNTDSMALSEWANTLNRGGDRDIVLAALARRLWGSNKETAKQIAQSIDNPSVRDHLLDVLK